MLLLLDRLLLLIQPLLLRVFTYGFEVVATNLAVAAAAPATFMPEQEIGLNPETF